MRFDDANVWRGPAVIGFAALIASCTQLETSTTNRCDTHADCDSGRMCRDGTCRAIEAAGPEEDAQSLMDGHVPIGRAGFGGAAAMNAPEVESGPGGMGGSTGSEAGDGSTTPDPGPQPHPSAELDAGEDDGGSSEEPEPDGRNDPCADRVVLWEQVALWLNGDVGPVVSEGRVQAWKDRSYYRHRAKARTRAPALWPEHVYDEQLEHSAVRFGPVDHAAGLMGRRIDVPDHPVFQVGYGDLTIVVVMRYRNPTTLATPTSLGLIYGKVYGPVFTGIALFANDDTASPEIASSFLYQMEYREDARVRTREQGLNDNRLLLLKAARLASGTSLAVNGGPPALYAESCLWDLSASGVPITIGANQSGEMQILDGDLFELVVLTGASASGSDAFVSCLLAKYGLAFEAPGAP